MCPCPRLPSQMDYKGEPTPYTWPNVNSHFGSMDYAGFAKDGYYYYQSVWTTQPMVHVFPHWNWDAVACAGMRKPGKTPADGKNVTVWAYSNADAVELLLNRHRAVHGNEETGFVTFLIMDTFSVT